MNVKFRMPKFNTNLDKNSMMKELLMTFIGTTLSIVLTFGTADYIDKKEKKNLGRQTAMMVIHDMDNTVELLKEYSKDEKKGLELARYVMDRYDTMDKIGEDTIWQVINFLMSDISEVNMYKFDESSEKLFLSSQDSWKNIDNAAFMDAVQDFYATRHEFFDQINHAPYWRKPFDAESSFQYFMEHSDQRVNLAELLEQYLIKREVIYYLDNASYRQDTFDDMAETIQSYSDLCKFTIGITDEELEEYVKNRDRTGRNVKESELVGKWLMHNTESTYSSYEFLEDHTYKQTFINHYSYPMYVGRMDITYHFTGTWELRADTLYMNMDRTPEVGIDHSNIKIKAGKEKEVEDYIQELKDKLKEYKDKIREKEDVESKYCATINSRGDKIEIAYEDEEESGSKRERVGYLQKSH